MLRLEQEHPELVTPIPPSQRVGGEPLPYFEKVRHTQPMLSLANAFNFEELQEFDRRIRRLAEVDGWIMFRVEDRRSSGHHPL